MAMMDYGAIAFKNGKLMTEEIFGNMVDMVGWEDSPNDVYTEYFHGGTNLAPIALNGNYFAYIGDKDCTIAFYKELMAIVERDKENHFFKTVEFFNCTRYKWRKWEGLFGAFENGHFPKVTVTKRNGYLICKWKYKGDKYKVYFGYGVDIGCYKKYRIVNYYRSLEYMLIKFKRGIKDVFRDFKWNLSR